MSTFEERMTANASEFMTIKPGAKKSAKAKKSTAKRKKK